MSDLERRLTDALTEGAHGAPSALGLADAARSRARNKRRTRIIGAAAALALCVGVPTAVVVTGDLNGDPVPAPGHGTVATDPAAPGQVLPGGYRYESWHDVTIEVPDSWAYGALGAWCAGDGSIDLPRVERWGTVREDILCSPAASYGVSFAPSQGGTVDWPVAEQHSDAWPDGAFVGATTVAGVVVTVAAPDVNLALEILGSVHRNEGLDPNSCPVDTGSDPVVPGDSMTVCRYDNRQRLEQSELLRGDDVQAAEDALRAAPEGGEHFCDQSRGPYVGEIRMSSVGEDAKIDLGCLRRLVRRGGSQKVTPDVLYWALSPGWSGTVPGGVSLPSELRQR